MNKLTLLLLLTLLMSFQANAAEENMQQVAKYKSSLTELNQLGIKLHRLNYDIGNRGDADAFFFGNSGKGDLAFH